MLKLVVDTNVIVSAMLKAESTSALILSLVMQGNCRICLSDKIFTEYREVLARDKFKHLDQASVEELLLALRECALLISPKPIADNLVADAADKMFLECALAAKADFIITGNKKHFPFEKLKGSRIVSPREFVNYLPVAK